MNRSEQSTARAPVPDAADRLRCLLISALGTTLCGLLWLGVSSHLAAIGREIATLDDRRQTLLERRVTALIAQAAASDPDRLAERAAALGLEPIGVARLETLEVDELYALEGSTPAGPPSPFSVSIQAASAHSYKRKNDDLSVLLLSIGAAMPASADELGSANSAEGR